MNKTQALKSLLDAMQSSGSAQCPVTGLITILPDLPASITLESKHPLSKLNTALDLLEHADLPKVNAPLIAGATLTVLSHYNLIGDTLEAPKRLLALVSLPAKQLLTLGRISTKIAEHIEQTRAARKASKLPKGPQDTESTLDFLGLSLDYSTGADYPEDTVSSRVSAFIRDARSMLGGTFYEDNPDIRGVIVMAQQKLQSIALSSAQESKNAQLVEEYKELAADITKCKVYPSNLRYQLATLATGDSFLMASTQYKAKVVAALAFIAPREDGIDEGDLSRLIALLSMKITLSNKQETKFDFGTLSHDTAAPEAKKSLKDILAARTAGGAK